MIKDDISLAQWALVEEIKAGQWKTLDFPRIARTDFGLNGIEFVNTLFEVPTINYLSELKNNADSHGVTMVLIMVDDEGDGCADNKEDRIQFGINHRKWVDAAHFLGCSAIRTNCRGPVGVSMEDALEWAAFSYHQLLEYAAQAGIRILIENHGGVSDNPDWMVSLMKKVNHPLFGTYPDWREPLANFNNFEYLKKTLPFAGGMSYRNQFSEELTASMIGLCQESGYKGWYGIESKGRQGVKKGVELLNKYLI
jgi:L-ribulose-5-phosphate 3-epimerase